MNQHVPPPPSDQDDAAWRHLTQTANQALESDELCRALMDYRDAFAEAERLFRAAERGDCDGPVTTIYVISCQNLADATRRAGDADAALTWLLRAFERLAAAAESPATPFGLRLDCMRDLKFAFINLIEPLRGDPAFQPEIEAYVARGRRVVALVFGVIRGAAQLPPELRLAAWRPDTPYS